MLAALKWGILIGALTYLVEGLALTAVALVLFGSSQASVATNPGRLTSGCLGLFLLLFAFSAAGFFTGKATARAGFGAAAGMIAFVVYATCITIWTPGGSSAVPTTSATAAPAASGMVQLVSMTLATLFVLGIAALMGWLGGRPGAQRARKRNATSDRAALHMRVSH